MHRKRSRNKTNEYHDKKGGNPKKVRHQEYDDDDDDFFQSDDEESMKKSESSEEEENVETVDEIKLRKVKEYLSTITKTDDGEDIDSDEINSRLREEAIEATGRMSYRKVDSMLVDVDPNSLQITYMRGHQLPVTAVRISDDEKYIYSASKDCNIIKWSVESGKKVFTYKGKRDTPQLGGHVGKILALALSSDGTLLASGGEDKVIRVWDTVEDKLVDSFKGHKDVVSGLAFRVGHHTLYSASFDRSVKIWNCDEMSYVETLYGHQSNILSLDALSRERCISSSYDKTVRIWKVVEGTQLQFTGGIHSIECVSLMNEDLFVSGTQEGSIQLWKATKRKPDNVMKLAHGIHEKTKTPAWITAIASLRYSNIFATGSYTGEIKIWATTNDFKIRHILSIPVIGYINSLQFSRSGGYLIAGVGQEHRLGRWEKNRNTKNFVVMIKLPIEKK